MVAIINFDVGRCDRKTDIRQLVRRQDAVDRDAFNIQLKIAARCPGCNDKVIFEYRVETTNDGIVVPGGQTEMKIDLALQQPGLVRAEDHIVVVCN